MRDPFIVNAGGERPYLLFMSDSWRKTGRGSANWCPAGVQTVSVSRSADLVNWSEPETCMTAPEWCGQIWAPEIHEWKGKWYMFVTLKERPGYGEPIRSMIPGEPDWEYHRGSSTNSTCHALWMYRADRPEGPYLPIVDKPITEKGYISLDGTLGVEDGKPWMIYTHDWAQVRVGTYELRPLSDDLTHFVGPAKTLFTAAEMPMCRGMGVTDGAFLYRSPKSGKLFMTWSTHDPSRTPGHDYCVVLCESATGKLAGPWVNHHYLSSDASGHGHFFRDKDGLPRFVMHYEQPTGEFVRIFEVVDEGDTLRLGKELVETRPVLDAVPPTVPDWTFNNRNGLLRLAAVRLDGETALCVSNPIPAKAAPGQDTKTSWSVVSPTFRVRGGKTLELALRMISPGPEAGGYPAGEARTGVAWLDARGKELGFRTMSFPRDEPFLRTHVRRVPVPADAVEARLSIGYGSPEFPRDGHVFALASAKARLVGPETEQDPAFEETSVPSLVRLTESPCEDAQAPIRLKIESRYALDEASIVCTLDGTASDRVRRTGAQIEVRPPDGGWKLPSWPEVRVTGRDVRGTRFADTQVCCFGTRVQRGVVSLRDDGMTLVDGRPFFPLGVYGVTCLKAADEPVLEKLKAAKFNAVQTYAGGKEDLDWFLGAAERHGLKAVIEPARRNFCRPRDVLETAYALRERPSLLTWYLGDDTATHQSAIHLREVGRCVKAVDDAHITSQSDSVLWRDLTLSRQTRLVGLTDVFIPQLYPAMKAEVTGRETPEITRDFLEYRRDLAAAGNPVTGIWPALQGFKGYGSWPRYPTAAEQRAQAWLSIVHGAKGLFWYTHHGNGRDGNAGLVDDPKLWESVTDVVAEIDRHKADLVTRDAKVQPTVEILEGEAKDELGFPALNVLLKEGEFAPLLVAVNSSSHPLRARISAHGLLSETVALAPLGVAVKRLQLPKAAFDHGGTTFDLKALSRRDFPATAEAGGLSFSAKRERDGDPKEVVVCELDWKKVREEFRLARKDPPRGVVFKYRFKQTRTDPFDPKVWLAIRGLNHNEKGELVECQGVWNTKIRETGDVWADYCYYDIGIRTIADTVRFTLKLGDALGSLEIKDFRPIPYRLKPEMDASKHLVALRQVGTGSFDGEFHLGRGQAGDVLLDWQLLDKEKAAKMKSTDCQLRLELPKGVELLGVTALAPHTRLASGAGADGGTFHEWKVHSEKCPVYGRWKGHFRPAFVIRSDLAAGTCAGVAKMCVKYDGKVVSRTVEMPILVDEPVLAKAIPKEYVNGIQCGPEVETNRKACEAFADTMVDAGFRGALCIREPFASILKEKGSKDARYFKGAGLYFIANGYEVGTHPPTPQKRPPDQRFVADDPKYRPDAMARATCPMAVYEKKSYYRDFVEPGLKTFFEQEGGRSDYDALLANWEPNPYFNHGCMCTNCLAEFVRWSKLPEADVRAGWPQNVRIGGEFRAQAEKFRAWQHGKLMKTLHRTFLDFLGPGSYGFCPMLAWTTATGQLREAPGAEEIASEEYMGDLQWFDPWGPYPWWDAQIPYIHEKRYCVAGWSSAKVIREKTDSTYANHVKLLSFPHGKQGNYWEVQPEWLELNLDAYFFNRWECSMLYKFPLGYDARWLRCCARATTRAGQYEDYVFKGEVADGRVTVEPVPEYAAPCHMVSAYLPATTNVSPLCTAAYDLGGARIVACINYWEEGEAFFTLRCRGLAKGDYTVVSDRETIWTRAGGQETWSAEDLEKGVFLSVGKARTKVFEIRPVGGQACGSPAAVNMLDQADVRRLYEAVRPALREAAERDHAEERSRTLLTPNGTPMI